MLNPSSEDLCLYYCTLLCNLCIDFAGPGHLSSAAVWTIYREVMARLRGRQDTHGFLQLQGGLEGLQRRAPLGGAGPGDVLEDDLAAALVLVLHQLQPVGALLLAGLLEEGGKARHGLR